MQSKRRSKKSTGRPTKQPKLSRTLAPADLSPVDWQRGLRRQFGREQAFGLENLGSEPFFSEFRVSNAASKSSYRVAIRGRGPGGNFCSCPDYATSELGTCKHIEFTLVRLEKKPDAKVVVFSQWTRTHTIIIRRLEARGLGYVSFHGGVPSEKRPALVERFRDDPACRVFLSTDAGSTGLNLQHASTLVNMDLPWNPAVLEQRIARIHRMGQVRPVRVINFVSKGTIEEGMLSVLAFKRSLSIGVLDGGSGEISLGGSRLNRFMKEVENVTGNMGEAVTPAEEVGSIVAAGQAASLEDAEVNDANAEENLGADERAIARTGDRSEALPRETGANPWQALMQVGLQFVEAVAAANTPGGATHPWIERDPTTGAQSLKMPLPPPETARQLANALSALADSLRGKAG